MPSVGGVVGVGGDISKLADTGPVSLPLVNGTPIILTAQTPNDGNLHTVIVAMKKVVVTTETGGAVGISVTEFGGTAQTQAAFAGALTGPASYSFPATSYVTFVVGPNAIVSISQTSALTGGSSGIQAQIWSS
jgi:hypothetical protein